MASYPDILPAESAQAYEAACAYFVMGADRSCEAVAQKYIKSVSLIRRWSGQHDWVSRAREYDAALSEEAAQQHTARYLADLADHQKRASEAGKALYSVAGKLLQQINVALANPKRIKGEDGKYYTLHGIELTASTFAIAARAFTSALDLEAHALGIDRAELDDKDE